VRWQGSRFPQRIHSFNFPKPFRRSRWEFWIDKILKEKINSMLGAQAARAAHRISLNFFDSHRLFALRALVPPVPPALPAISSFVIFQLESYLTLNSYLLSL
jgi:hypothetical protein